MAHTDFPPSVSGDRCEFDRRQGRCMPGVCRNGGTCRELSGGGFRCECPAGGYERPYCTVTARSFPPKSFVMFRGLRQRFHLSISLTWVNVQSLFLSLFFFDFTLSAVLGPFFSSHQSWQTKNGPLSDSLLQWLHFSLIYFIYFLLYQLHLWDRSFYSWLPGMLPLLLFSKKCGFSFHFCLLCFLSSSSVPVLHPSTI